MSGFFVGNRNGGGDAQPSDEQEAKWHIDAATGSTNYAEYVDLFFKRTHIANATGLLTKTIDDLIQTSTEAGCSETAACLETARAAIADAKEAL